MRSFCNIIACTVLLPFIAEAQDRSLAAGARVRVTAPNLGLDKHVGTVVEMRGDSVVVARKGRSRTIAVRDIPTFEVSTGRRLRVLPYALLGLGVGAVGGYALGYASYDGASFLSNSASDEGTWVGVTLGVIGLFTGAITGVFHRGDSWAPVEPAVRPSVGRTRSGGVSVGFSRRF